MVFSKIEKMTYDLALPIVEGEGYAVYDIEYVKEGPHWFLRVFIDRDGGVDVDDCEVISRALSTALDEKNFVQDNYFLEVSSPGIERSLRQDEHFQMAVGSSVRIKLFRPIDGVREIEGELVSAEGTQIEVSTELSAITIEKKNIAKANILFEF